MSLSRRSMLKALAATVALPHSPLFAAGAKRRPNVIFILSDDQGSIDLNCYGAKDLFTPNLDRLAAEGVRFTQFYAAASVCSPSRAAILTGRYPHRAGLPQNAPSHPGGAGGMPGEQLTIAEVLKGAGYTTGHVGKWHIGYTPERMPNGQGFHHSFGHMGGCIDNYSHYFYWVPPNRHDLWRNGKEVWHEGEFFGDLMVRECNQFIEASKDKPFFLYWAINFPHYPLQGKSKWREKYKDLDSPRNMYAAFVSTMDEMIGQVLAKLDELGLAEDTIVIFQGDQGHSCEDRTFGGGGNSGPYRGAKSPFFEGGIRVPAIVRWPGKLPKGQVREQLVTGCDWFPTIVEMAGAELPQRKIDGSSITSIIQSADAASPHQAWHWMMGNQWAVREGDWKLLGNPTDPSKKAPIGPEDKLFLVNLKDDVGEMKNVAGAHPEIVARLRKLHEEWAKDVINQ